MLIIISLLLFFIALLLLASVHVLLDIREYLEWTKDAHMVGARRKHALSDGDRW